MALTTEQLCYINNLLYSKSPSLCDQGVQSSYEGRTLGDMVKMIDARANENPTCSNTEWVRMKSEIMSDQQLMNLQVVDTSYDKSTGDAHCLLVDPSTNEAVVAFRGTGGNEWKDNFVAGSEMEHGSADSTISVQQQVALDYADSLDLAGYDSVTVTGHSKGGNKAKLIALMNNEVDRCVSFDGQGFSDEFMEAHGVEIAANQHKIENHNVDGDFVNILLNDVGETTYYEGQRIGDNFPKNHDASSFFNNNGEMVVGQQSEGMQELDYFLNSMIRSVEGEQRADILDFTGEVFQALLGFGGSAEKAMDVLLDPRYTEEASYMLAYAMQYEHETGKITVGVADVLRDMGLGDFNKYVAIANVMLGNDHINTAIKYLAQSADDIPNWVLDLARKGSGISEEDLSDEDLRQILSILAKSGEKMNDIAIDENAGADIKVESTTSTFSASGTIHGGAGASFAVGAFDFSDMIIFVNFAEMMECCEQLRRAVEHYNEAITITRNAAADLAANWEGEAREAFVADQTNAFRWYTSLSEVASGVVNALKQSHDRYYEMVTEAADILRI